MTLKTKGQECPYRNDRTPLRPINHQPIPIVNNIKILINDVYDKPSKAVYYKTTALEHLFELAENHNAFCTYLKGLGKKAFVLRETEECIVALLNTQSIKKTNILLRLISEIMPVYVECIVQKDLIIHSTFLLGYKNEMQIFEFPRTYPQTRRTFGNKEAAMKRLLCFYKSSQENEEDECLTKTIYSIDNIGSNDCLIYLYHNEQNPAAYYLDKDMKHSYDYIAEDIDLVASDFVIEEKHEKCDYVFFILHIPVDISNIKVGELINYATFEHLETECQLEMSSLNNGAGIGKEVFSFAGNQFGLDEELVFILTSTNAHTYFYKRIN